MMIIKVEGSTAYQASPIGLRCPGCSRESTFEPLTSVPNDASVSGYIAGMRRCSNRACRALVFVILRAADHVVISYPPALAEFDSNSIPEGVSKTFKEALVCYAHQCFTAAGMLVRKTLEQVCEDRGATGRDLKARLADLRTKVILPPDLLDAADALRLLGNDAAHIEAKSYNDIGETELAPAILLTKEILKALYQYAALVSQLNALRK